MLIDGGDDGDGGLEGFNFEGDGGAAGTDEAASRGGGPGGPNQNQYQSSSSREVSKETPVVPSGGRERAAGTSSSGARHTAVGSPEIAEQRRDATDAA